MRTYFSIFCSLLTLVGVSQNGGAELKPTTNLGGTVFKDYADASIFLKGLIGAEADAYGNVEIFKDGSWGQRLGFRLSDVVLTAREFTTAMEYYGGEIGPRIEITAKCSLGPCISDPLTPGSSSMEEKSFFITDIPKGKQVFATLITMQGSLKK